MKTARPPSTSGSALLLVLWALFVLSAAVLAYVNVVMVQLKRAGDSNRALEAKAMAHSGLAIALHPMVTEKTPLLEEAFNDQMGYRVRIIGEGGKLNINYLLQGEDPRKLDILRHWLEYHGLTFQERDRLIDCLLDWTDGDNIKRLNGVEDEDTYHPANRPFQSIDEMEEVAGMEPLLAVPGWRDEVTIYSQGQIDLSAATEATLRLLPGMSEPRIARFLEIRRGRDGVDGTLDDVEFKTLKDIGNALGFGQAQMKALSGLVVQKDQTVRIISEGQSADIVRQVEVVARKSGASPAIVLWKE
ncbi:MAG: hypothetical protein ABI680_02960 [Chthoniobacteraceae bacterium]